MAHKFIMNKPKAHCDDPNHCLKCLCDGWTPANYPQHVKRRRRNRRKRERFLTETQMELEKAAIEEIKKTMTQITSKLH